MEKEIREFTIPIRVTFSEKNKIKDKMYLEKNIYKKIKKVLT